MISCVAEVFYTRGGSFTPFLFNCLVLEHHVGRVGTDSELRDNSDNYSSERSEPHTPLSLIIYLISTIHPKRNACKLNSKATYPGAWNPLIWQFLNFCSTFFPP